MGVPQIVQDVNRSWHYAPPAPGYPVWDPWWRPRSSEHIQQLPTLHIVPLGNGGLNAWPVFRQWLVVRLTWLSSLD